MKSLKHHWRKTPQPARKVIVLIIGIVLMVAGVFMLVLPGPGWATIFLGLAVIATEFERAEALRAKLVERFKKTVDTVRKKTKR